MACVILDYQVSCALGADREQTRARLRADATPLTPLRSELGGPETYVGALPTEPPTLLASYTELDSRVARIWAAILDGMRTTLRTVSARYDASRIGVVIGASTGGLEGTERTFHNDPGGKLSRQRLAHQHDMQGVVELTRRMTGARGPGHVVSTACSSSGKALASAQRMLMAGVVDVVIAGGVDSLTQTTLRGFDSLGILSRAPCRPFHAERDGINIGEGGAAFVLCRQGDARARLLGTGESADAHHMTAPHPTGLGAITAMRDALARAQLDASAIDLINAHGTGTKHNDLSEALAISSVLGRHVPTVSTKGYTGHALGAAGAIEAALCLLSIEDGYVPASLGATPVDPAVEIAIATVPSTRPIRHVLSNSFAFGGSNVALILGAAS